MVYCFFASGDANTRSRRINKIRRNGGAADLFGNYFCQCFGQLKIAPTSNESNEYQRWAKKQACVARHTPIIIKPRKSYLFNNLTLRTNLPSFSIASTNVPLAAIAICILSPAATVALLAATASPATV